MKQSKQQARIDQLHGVNKLAYILGFESHWDNERLAEVLETEVYTVSQMQPESEAMADLDSLKEDYYLALDILGALDLFSIVEQQAKGDNLCLFSA